MWKAVSQVVGRQTWKRPLIRMMQNTAILEQSENVVQKQNSPLINQYLQLKEPGSLLMFRVGDFYEFFLEDAKLVSKTLQLTLTKFGKGEKEVPMCGVPVHSADVYIHRLVQKGFNVSISDQGRDKTSDGLIKRSIVRRITPGTYVGEGIMDPRTPNYLCALHHDNEEHVTVSWIDVSTGEFKTSTLPHDMLSHVLHELKPSELLVSDKYPNPDQVASFNPCFVKDPCPSIVLRFPFLSSALLTDHHRKSCMILFEYLDHLKIGDLTSQRVPEVLEHSSHLLIDSTAHAALEISSSPSGNPLISLIDQTCTVSGALLLRRRIQRPFGNVEQIEAQQNFIKEFRKNTLLVKSVRQELKEFPDVLRGLQKISMDRAVPGDLLRLMKGVRTSERIFQHLKSSGFDELVYIPEELKQLAQTIDDTLEEDEEGCVSLRTSVNSHLVALHKQLGDHEVYKHELLQKYANTLGLAVEKLKVESNGLLGGYIQISRANSVGRTLPRDWTLLQEMKARLRYSCSGLVRYFQAKKNTEAEIHRIEQKVLAQLRDEIIKVSSSLQSLCDDIAKIDVTLCFTYLSNLYSLECPKVDNSISLDIHQGRHLVVERQLARSCSSFIPNDVNLPPNENCWLLTGPNMAGKSVLLRMVGTIVLLAHLGSFVPAESAHIGIVDRVGCRVGSSDDIVMNRSSFRVEMDQVSFILSRCTNRSLVLMDEVGRGTAVWDGFSLAASTLEYLHSNIRCRTIFASHFHQLSFLSSLNRLALRNMQTIHTPESHEFLHKVCKGVADESYGLEVAKIAHLPPEVTQRAEQLMQQLAPLRSQLETALRDAPRKPFEKTSHGNRPEYVG